MSTSPPNRFGLVYSCRSAPPLNLQRLKMAAGAHTAQSILAGKNPFLGV
jgi:hypothetical protein